LDFRGIVIAIPSQLGLAVKRSKANWDKLFSARRTLAVDLELNYPNL
jgi:hypothetical protein